MKYLVALALAGLAACSTQPAVSLVDNGTDSTTARLGVDQLGNTPLPVGTVMRGPESLVFGVGDNWMGRAVLSLPGNASDSYGFFAEQFPRQGWLLVAAVRGKKNMLVFTRGERSATVDIEEGNLFTSATAQITISPTGVAPRAGSGAQRP